LSKLPLRTKSNPKSSQIDFSSLPTSKKISSPSITHIPAIIVSGLATHPFDSELIKPTPAIESKAPKRKPLLFLDLQRVSLHAHFADREDKGYCISDLFKG
jgi:hypothetical protein